MDSQNVFQIINNSYSQLVLVILAIVSATIAFKSYYGDKKRKKIDKAIQLSRFYQEFILFKSSEINHTLNGSKLDKLSTTAFGSVENAAFTYQEAELLLKKQIKTKITEFEDIIQEFAKESDDKKRIISVEIPDLMNTLEWFSMYFVNHIADDKTAYQSLHQTYLGIVRQLYFFISKNNKDEYNKYFTNIIELYNTWQSQSNKVQQKEAKINEKLRKKKNKLSKTKRSYH